jgi:SWI/SNF-related matrix-associated actin-dependent regulator 1 of chromatin subfamily A
VQLKPFQQQGVEFLVPRTRALLADEPGVGKTGQIITAANVVGARHLGIVVPEIGVRHWERELNKWNSTADRADIIPWGQAHDAAARRQKQAPAPLWDVLIPDESHFGKNPQARRTKAVFAKGGLGYYARRIWAASGTPAPNNISELWPLMRAFGKTGMDEQSFKNYFCLVNDLTGKVVGNRPERVEELRAILKTFALRRLKKDVLPELGAIDIQEWYVKPSGAFCAKADLHSDELKLQARLAGLSDEEILVYLAGDTEFATLRRYNALLKAPAIFDTVKFEQENGLLDRVVIYGYHREAMQALYLAFRRASIAVFLIFGDTPKADRDGIIERWKVTPGGVLIASSIIASTVLDFTAAHQGIMLEMDWVPGNNFQAMQRMHRHGQEYPVSIRVASGTPIDDIINGVLIRKIEGLAEIFD